MSDVNDLPPCLLAALHVLEGWSEENAGAPFDLERVTIDDATDVNFGGWEVRMAVRHGGRKHVLRVMLSREDVSRSGLNDWGQSEYFMDLAEKLVNRTRYAGDRPDAPAGDPDGDPMVAAFLEDICSRPFTDAPRLIFSDWLEDHGKEDWAKEIRHGIARGQPLRFPRLHLLKYAPDLYRLIPAGEVVSEWVTVERGFASRCRFKDTETWMDNRLNLITRIPFEHVTLDDRHPRRIVYPGGRVRYGWYMLNGEYPRCRVPADHVYDDMIGGESHSHGRVVDFERPEHAVGWLSMRLLSHAWRLARRA